MQEGELGENRIFRNKEYALQCRVAVLTKAERDKKKREAKITASNAEIAEALKSWDPHKDPKIEV